MTIELPSALYFPATRLPLRIAGPLLLPFGKLFCYKPDEGKTAMPQPLAAAGLVAPYAPVPLGEQLDRFRRLLKDMQTHAAEYFQAYLSSLAAGAGEDIEAGWQQVARRLKETTPATASQEDILWRARLYLALAEQELTLQEELAAGIEGVGRREAELLRHLQGDDEELAELPLFAAAPATAAPTRNEQLLAAWGLLYLADRSPERPWLLTTAQEEEAGLLFEEYEAATGRRPEQLLSLAMPLPAAGTEEEFMEQRQAFQAAGRDLLDQLGDFLTRAAGGEAAAPGPSATELTAAWQGLLTALEEKEKPAAAGEASGPVLGGALTFYRLPGVSFPQLFRRFCRQDHEPPGPSTPNAVLAVLDAGKR